jgi:hypothetical protein
MREALQRFREYEKLGVQHIIQMDPDDRTTFAFVNGDLVGRIWRGLRCPSATCQAAGFFRSIAASYWRRSITNSQLVDIPLTQQAPTACGGLTLMIAS